MNDELPSPARPMAAAILSAPFLISATVSPQERQTRTLKHDDTFAVFDHSGDIESVPGSPEGLFHRDTRHLSKLGITLDGSRPILLSSSLRDDNATLTCDLANPGLYDAQGRLVLEHDVIYIRRSRFLWKACCFERILVRNFDMQARQIRVDVDFDADFADLFEVRGTRRDRRGTTHAPSVGSGNVDLSYTGLDNVRRTTHLSFDPQPDQLDGDRAVFAVELQPHESRSLFVRIGCSSTQDCAPPALGFLAAMREARRALRASSSRAAAIVTSNEIFNEAARRSVSDLYMLMTELPEGSYPYAGIPWFSTVFGRDGLITALQMLWIDPSIARGVLGHLAANQATVTDPVADAEPGKILHEVRHGEMAELAEVPFRRYYGSVDSTPLFVMLAAAYLRRTGDFPTLRGLWPNITAALDWIERYGDRDGDGFVEYGRRNEKGLINQGWKDSHDSVFHADGTLAQGPIALVEVQAYVYGAWCGAAQIARGLGHADQASAYDERAERLRQSFDASFFDRELDTYVLALDGQKRPCRIRTSNAGHALLTGIALPERAEAVVGTLMGPAFFCGWGIRTLAATEARYNPISYHNGSVWPHDNALIAAGFARHGFQHQAAAIFGGLFAASTYIDLRRLPELFCGFSRKRTYGPTFYPVACQPQAWAAAAPLFMLQSCLGLSFDPLQAQITFAEPTLPDFLDEVILQNLEISGHMVKIALRRSGDRVIVDVLERSGPVRVITTT